MSIDIKKINMGVYYIINKSPHKGQRFLGVAMCRWVKGFGKEMDKRELLVLDVHPDDVRPEDYTILAQFDLSKMLNNKAYNLRSRDDFARLVSDNIEEYAAMMLLSLTYDKALDEVERLNSEIDRLQAIITCGNLDIVQGDL